MKITKVVLEIKDLNLEFQKNLNELTFLYEFSELNRQLFKAGIDINKIPTFVRSGEDEIKIGEAAINA